MLEYAIFHAGPGAGAILGDMGADVTKIESGSGDPIRIWTQVGGFDFSLTHDRNLMFELANRNKRDITLDIMTPKGREVFHRLVEGTDVFLTNLRKSTKQKLGLDYETLSNVNPRLIHANVSGYGPNGPICDMGAYDPMGQARSGMMFATGSKEPTLMQLAVLDQATAIAASHAILSALLVRERWGIGQEVHVSLYSTAIWLLYANMMANSLMDVEASIPWQRTYNSPLRNNFRCKDGGWIMSVHHPPQKYWQALCEATGQEALLDDPRFSDEDKRNDNSAELVSIFDKVFLTKTRNEWMEIFRQYNLMFCPVQTFSEVSTDPQALENDYVIDIDHPDFGKVNIPGYPIHLSQTPAGPKSAAPTLGQHTDDVLREAGYSDKEIKQLRQEKII